MSGFEAQDTVLCFRVLGISDAGIEPSGCQGLGYRVGVPGFHRIENPTARSIPGVLGFEAEPGVSDASGDLEVRQGSLGFRFF